MTDFISFKLSTVIVCFVHIIVCKWWWEWTLWIQFLLGKSSNTTRKIKSWLIYNFPISFERLLFHWYRIIFLNKLILSYSCLNVLEQPKLKSRVSMSFSQQPPILSILHVNDAWKKLSLLLWRHTPAGCKLTE